MSLEEPKFRKYIEGIFESNGADFNNILLNIGQDRNKLLVNAHFYYFICLPDKGEDDVRSEMRIVGMVSLIEAMMQDVDFKDFFEYFEYQYKNKNQIEDYKMIKEEYLDKYGSARKIRKYFEKYVPAKDQKIMIDGIKKYNRNNYLETTGEGKKLLNDFVACDDIQKASAFKDEIDEKDDSFIELSKKDELAKLLYQMRSDFVHSAEMRGFCPFDCISSLVSIGKNIYDIKIDINTILKVFERSFVKFWSERATN